MLLNCALYAILRFQVLTADSAGSGFTDTLLIIFGMFSRAVAIPFLGKVGVSEAILSKPGPLDDREWEEMRQHPAVGEQICSELRFAKQVGPIIRHHHERWDGRGYIDGLAGEDIPLLVRVVSIVDAYDAMTSDRPYRAALPVTEALSRFEAGAGEQWDPDIGRVFVQTTRRTVRQTEPAGVHRAI